MIISGRLRLPPEYQPLEMSVKANKLMPLSISLPLCNLLLLAAKQGHDSE